MQQNLILNCILYASVSYMRAYLVGERIQYIEKYEQIDKTAEKSYFSNLRISIWWHLLSIKKNSSLSHIHNKKLNEFPECNTTF